MIDYTPSIKTKSKNSRKTDNRKSWINKIFLSVEISVQKYMLTLGK